MTPGKIVAIVVGILMFIGGIYCFVTPVNTYMALGWIIGAVMIIEGVGSLCSWQRNRMIGLADNFTLVGAIISVVLGVIVCGSMATQYAFDLFIAYMAAAWVVITGIFRVVSALSIRNVLVNGQKPNVVPAMVLGIVLIIIGVIGFVNPVFIMATYGMIIGVTIIIAGLALISIAFV